MRFRGNWFRLRTGGSWWNVSLVNWCFRSWLCLGFLSCGRLSIGYCLAFCWGFLGGALWRGFLLAFHWLGLRGGGAGHGVLTMIRRCNAMRVWEGKGGSGTNNHSPAIHPCCWSIFSGAKSYVKIIHL